MPAAVLALLSAATLAAGQIVVSPKNVLFGTAQKNAVIGPASQGELTIFSHTCTNSPCAITTMHFPSIYPTGGAAFDWENGRVRVRVDGEADPSIDVLLREIAHIGALGAVSNKPPADGSPFGSSAFGKTSRTGGVYSTVRIPFSQSINITLQAPPSATGASIYWVIIRGIESLPVVLDELQLPPTAKLQVARTSNVTLAPQEFITLASAPANPSGGGALISMLLDVASADPNYLEGCFRFFPNAAGANASTPVFLSSGTEDFFLSASYFDEGMFKTELSGLTYYAGGGASMAAYRLFSRDLVLFGADGMQLGWRNNEVSGAGESDCPNAWYPPGEQRPVGGAAVSEPAAQRAQRVRALKGGTAMLPDGNLRTAPATVNALVWYYTY